MSSTTSPKPGRAARVSPPERASRPRQRLRLIEACISALAEHGPSRTTIDKVVAIADMSPGIVNFYFDTKAALLVACLEHLAQEFEERVMAPILALRTDPAAALDRMIELYLDPDIASPRKVSVWYAFWGEAASRGEYFAICGKRDLAFAELTRDLVAARITARGEAGQDADALALGLIGCLEMQWQDIAFRDEKDIDRDAQRRRCRAYLTSIFPPRRADITAAAPATGHDLLVAARLMLAGIPAAVLPGPQPSVVAHTPHGRPINIAVRAQISRDSEEQIKLSDLPRADFVAFLLYAAGEQEPGLFLVPAAAVQARRQDSLAAGEIGRVFAAWRGNLSLADGR